MPNQEGGHEHNSSFQSSSAKAVIPDFADGQAILDGRRWAIRNPGTAAWPAYVADDADGQSVTGGGHCGVGEMTDAEFLAPV